MNIKRPTQRIVFPSVLIFFLLNFSSLFAQQSIKGTPISFSERYKAAFAEETAVVKVPALNLAKIKKEDQSNPSNRFAAPVTVNYTLENSGTWTELNDGGRVWKMKIKSDGALGLFILYKNFYLPNGARLYVYNESRTQVLGAYTNLNNSESGKFLTGMIKGETAILEYYEPRYAKAQGRFEINKIMQAYQPEKMNSDYPYQNHTGFGESLPCHNNINCALGDDWQNQKRGVARMLTVYELGIGWCTGTLLNTTEQDGRPYLLTANHCGYLASNVADFPLWRFDFNFEFPTCADETTEPAFSSLLGCEPIAGQNISDFLLLELSSNVPSSYNAYFNGWNRAVGLPENGTLIHHPFGDVRKISVDTNTLESYPFETDWQDGNISPSHSHYRSILDEGTIEGGSSGAPLFDHDGLVVGQLHGGVADCTKFFTYDGKLSLSWDEGTTPATRLHDWLDPQASGVLTVAGIENPALMNNVTVVGKIEKENGVAMEGVTIEISGGTNATNTLADGTFESGDLEIGNNFTVTPSFNTTHRDGINTIDMLLMRQHILRIGTPLTPYQIIAGDVDQDGDVDTIDMLWMRKLILTLDTEFPNPNAWRFVPTNYQFDDPTEPLNEPFPETITYEPILASLQDQDFIAIKLGDLNNSAN